MATDSQASITFPQSVAVPLAEAEGSCDDLSALEQERPLVVLMTPKRPRCGVGRVMSRTRAVPRPAVELGGE